MGVVLIASLLLLIGNIVSDVLVALVDPRIRFQ
jgi:microcin C transport system permease protein